MTEERSSSYFAYGTLLGKAAMQDYCPSAETVDVARYPGHRLEFRQYSDDPARCGCHVGRSDDDLYGVVYALASLSCTIGPFLAISAAWVPRSAILP